LRASLHPDELQTLRRLIEAHPSASRAQLSRQVCELFDWRKPNGELKDMTCRVAMLRMQADGLLTLPAARWAPLANPSISPPPPPIPNRCSPSRCMNCRRSTCARSSGSAHSRLWNEYIARYHYLGYTPMAGSQSRYFVFAGEPWSPC
jgi:hypothetical protein